MDDGDDFREQPRDEVDARHGPMFTVLELEQHRATTPYPHSNPISKLHRPDDVLVEIGELFQVIGDVVACPGVEVPQFPLNAAFVPQIDLGTHLIEEPLCLRRFLRSVA